MRWSSSTTRIRVPVAMPRHSAIRKDLPWGATSGTRAGLGHGSGHYVGGDCEVQHQGDLLAVSDHGQSQVVAL